MSYADVAASGPPQPASEKMPAHVPEIAHDDSGVHSTDNLGSQNDHIQSVASSTISYADQQQFEEDAAEARRESKRIADEIAKEARDFVNVAEHDVEQATDEARDAAKDFGKQASEKYEQTKSKIQKDFSDLKDEIKSDDKVKKAESFAEKNKRNPVIIGNAVVLTTLTGLLGVGAYRLHKTNALTWKVAGAWAGAVGLFAVGDYFVSQYFFKRYPPKQ